MAVPNQLAEESERTLKLLDRALSRISDFTFPALEVHVPDPDVDDDDDDEAFTSFSCPWCEKDLAEDDISAVENCIRISQAAELNDNDQTTLYFDYSDGEEQGWDTIYFKCGKCDKPVSLPDGWDADAY